MNVYAFSREKREIFDKMNSNIEGRNKFIDLLVKLDLDNEVSLFEMYPYKGDVIKGRKLHWQDKKLTRYANTRTKLKTETRAEIDRLPFAEALKSSWRIINELIKREYHFSVFYADGGRSPHIIIYDFEELKELDAYQREMAQKEFWRSIAPFDFHLLDHSIWQDDHYVPLEFVPHWKHESVFDLMFEWVPGRDMKCKN